MDTENHPDPLHDALSHGLQRAVQIVSSAVTGAQAYAYLKRAQARTMAERGERIHRTQDAQISLERDTARAGWAPALDHGWVQQADFFQAARAWGAAMPYADPSAPWYEPAAETAMRRCEERLRALHPNAMARYDRLRGQGMGPAEAMHEAAFLFAGPPRAYDPAYTPRPALDAGNGENPTWAATKPSAVVEDSGDLTAADAQERRGRQIINALQARARAQGGGLLGEAEQRIVLETVTNLPADVIDRVVRTETASRAPRAARPWEQDFPLPINDVVATATGAARTTPAAPAAASARATPHARPAGPRP